MIPRYMAEAVFPPDRSRYAWVIEVDHLAVPGAEPGSFCDNAATVRGPSEASDELLARLDAGEGDVFRMLDDDGELYYSGRIVFADEPPEGGEDFGPLDDFGGPNAGATEIQYVRDGKWVTL